MDTSLQQILKGVSRSFFLSVQLCPSRMRAAVGIGFLFCKLADTIADTEALSLEQRLQALEDFRTRFINRNLKTAFQVELAHGGSVSERLLLSHYTEIVKAFEQLSAADQEALFWLVPVLTQGMITDLTFFQPRKVVHVLPDEASLDQYTFHVAGCVGIFWTKLIRNHFCFAKSWKPDVERAGEQLGKGLQLVNILRDLPRDLQLGRCYLPGTSLKKFGITIEDLQNPLTIQKCHPLLLYYAEKAEKYLNAGKEYRGLLPWYARRMRASVALPVLLGFETLKLLRKSEDWLNPEKVVKVKRSKVYYLLLKSF